MKQNPSRNDKEEIRELLRLFENLKNGRSQSFLEEESFEKLIDHFDDKEDYPQALQAAELGIEIYPYSSVLLVKKADLLLATRQYKAALEVLDQAELLDHNDINLFILRTDAYLALDQQQKAVELLEEGLQLFTGDERLELLFELADVYDDYEEFEKVFDCLKLILEEEPTNEEALYKICFWTDFTGRNEESIKLHLNIINDNPYSELAWFNLGAAYQGLKLYEKSIDAYMYCITIDEKFDYAYRNIGDAYIRLRKYKDAIEMLEKVPEDSKLYYKIACTYINESQYESGIKQLQQALRIQRLQPEYNLAMGMALVEIGEYKTAIEYYANVIKSRPKNVKGWSAILECMLKADMLDNADEYALAAYEATGSKPVFIFYRAAIFFAQGKTKQAITQLEYAMATAPKLIKKLIELQPKLMQHPQVVDIIARYKRTRSI